MLTRLSAPTINPLGIPKISLGDTKAHQAPRRRPAIVTAISSKPPSTLEPHPPGFRVREALAFSSQAGHAVGVAVSHLGAVAALIDAQVGGGHNLWGPTLIGTSVSAAVWLGACVAMGYHKAFHPAVYMSGRHCMLKAREACEHDRLAEALTFLRVGTSRYAYESPGDPSILSEPSRTALANYAAECGAWKEVAALVACGVNRQAVMPVLRAAAAAQKAGTSVPVVQLMSDLVLHGYGLLTPEAGVEASALVRHVAPSKIKCSYDPSDSCLKTLLLQPMDDADRRACFAAWARCTTQAALSTLNRSLQTAPSRAALLVLVDRLDKGALETKAAEAFFQAFSCIPDSQRVAIDQAIVRWGAGTGSEQECWVAIGKTGARVEAGQVALVRHCLAAWTLGDERAALEGLACLCTPASEAMRVLGAVGATAVAMHRRARALDLGDAARFLISTVGAHGSDLHRTQLLKTELEQPHPDTYSSELFGNGRLKITDLSSDIQLKLARQAGIGNYPPPWDTDEQLTKSFTAICSAWSKHPQLPQLLTAWRTTFRNPTTSKAFRELTLRSSAGIERLGKALVDKEITDKGMLLGLHMLAVDPKVLDTAGAWRLVRSRYVTKDEPQVRRAMKALSYIWGKNAPVDATVGVLAWPEDGDLRAMLLRRWRTGHFAALAAVPAWQRGAMQRGEARRLIDEAGAAHEALLLHAAFVHRQGQAEGIQGYQAEFPALLQELRSAIALLRPRLPRTDAETHSLLAELSAIDISAAGHSQQVEKVSKRIGQWARQNAKHPDQSQVGALAIQVVAQLTATLRLRATMRKPPAKGSTDEIFLQNSGGHSSVAALHGQVVAHEQLDGLFTLSMLRQLSNGTVAPGTPHELSVRLMEQMNLRPNQRVAFENLLGEFRNPALFWAFMAYQRSYSSLYRDHSLQALDSVLSGTYHAQRRNSEQMRYFAQGADAKRLAMLDAWDAGASKPGTGNLAGLTLEDTGSFCDFASSGDEIRDSCHSLYRGGYAHNLLGRMRDGSKRMLTIKAADGTLKARAMWRLMSDKEGNPVAVLSRIYWAAGLNTAGAEGLLKEFARERGDALGIVAGSSRSGAGLGYTGPLTSRSGPLSDYWDEGGPHCNGAYVL